MCHPTARAVALLPKLRAALEAGYVVPRKHFLERGAERGFSAEDAIRAVQHGRFVVYNPPCGCSRGIASPCGCSVDAVWVVGGPIAPEHSERVLWVVLQFDGDPPVALRTAWFADSEPRGGEIAA